MFKSFYIVFAFIIFAFAKIDAHPAAGEGLNASTVATNSKNMTSEDTVVKIYTMEHFLGIAWSVDIGHSCRDIPWWLYKKTSSINTLNKCVLLFDRQKCLGRHVRIAPGTNGHSNLGAVHFDDAAASARFCDADKTASTDKKPAAVQDKETNSATAPGKS